MKVALVYDRINKWGGAERVLLSLHKMFPQAPLYTSVYDKKKASWAKVFRVKTSFLQHVPFIVDHHEYFPFLMPFAFQLFSFKKFDLVISVTSEYAKAVRVEGKTKHVCICLTPTRYLWSGYNEYFENKTFRSLTKPLVWLLRAYDKKIAQLPHMYIAISHEVQKRIKKYYKRDSVIIYPPLPSLPHKKNVLLERGYFLVVSRLSRFTQYKRVDLAVRAATQLGASLVVVGDGDREYFSPFAGPTIHFTGKVTDTELSCYYQNCRALIFPGKEDFGLSMAESLSFGKPVIAYNSGGAREIVRKNTGILFNSQSVPSLVRALKRFRYQQYNSATCKKAAAVFSEKTFEKRLRRVLSEISKQKQ